MNNGAVPPSGDPAYRRNFGDLAYVAVRAFPDWPAVIQGDVTLTYRQLDARMKRVAGMLRGLDVAPGSRVALLFPNEWPFVEALFGSMRAGAVPVPLNIRLGYETLRYCVEHSDAAVLVASGALRELAERLRSDVPALRALVVTGEPPPGTMSYDRLLADAPAEFESAAVAPDDICMQPYTSGSTGRPKGVLLTHAGQYWNAEMVRRVMMLDETDRALVAVPLYHKNAMAAAVKPILMAGGALVILPGFDPAEVIKAIARHRCTYITGTPAMFRLVLNQKRLLAEYDVTSLRWAACGSAMVPPDLLREFEETFGASISEGYGLTEGGPVVFENPRFGPRKIGSTGLPLPGCEIRVVADGREAGVGEPGELWTRNPGLARGYYKAPELTAAKFDRDGWLHTGDLVRRDEQGYYYILGRVDDMINVGGENVYPKEVEDLLLLHPAVREAYVVPVAHAVKGEAPVAFIVLHEERSATAEELKQFFLARGPAYAHPRAVLFLEQAPLGSTGKVDRQALRTRAADSIGTLQEGATRPEVPGPTA